MEAVECSQDEAMGFSMLQKRACQIIQQHLKLPPPFFEQWNCGGCFSKVSERQSD